MTSSSSTDNEHVNAGGRIDEYKCLQQELVWNIECQVKERNQCIIAASALIGYGLANSVPLLYVVAWLVVFQYWRQFNVHRSHVVKISRYIALFLDGPETGLMWNTRVGLAEKYGKIKCGVEPSQKRWVIRVRALTAPHSVFSLTAISLLILNGVPTVLSVPRWQLALLFIVGALANTLVTFRLIGPTWSKMREDWSSVWDAVRQEENAQRAGGYRR